MQKQLNDLNQFRQRVYQDVLTQRRDALFEMMDAIASSPQARSTVEISQSEHLRRTFSSVYKGLSEGEMDAAALRPLLVAEAERVGELEVLGYAIWALDHTAKKREQAKTLEDRSYAASTFSVHSGEGIVIGHQYSILARVMFEQGSWMGVVDCERIPTHTTPVELGAQQVARFKTAATQPSVIAMDCEYLTQAMLSQADARTRLLIRMKSHRKVWEAPLAYQPGQRGRPAQVGVKMKLNQPATHRAPDVSHVITQADGNTGVISVWANLRLRTHPHLPVCVVRVQVFDPQGVLCHRRPMWLLWTGEADLDWSVFWQVYLKRFCIECLHQFTKNSLVWAHSRLSTLASEEHLAWLVMLAYWQLLLAAFIVTDCYRPWEKPMPEGRLPTPARVQRAIGGIFKHIATPARPPKLRGIPPGRLIGFRPQPRPRCAVVRKVKQPLSHA